MSFSFERATVLLDLRVIFIWQLPKKGFNTKAVVYSSLMFVAPYQGMYSTVCRSVFVLGSLLKTYAIQLYHCTCSVPVTVEKLRLVPSVQHKLRKINIVHILFTLTSEH